MAAARPTPCETSSSTRAAAALCGESGRAGSCAAAVISVVVSVSKDFPLWGRWISPFGRNGFYPLGKIGRRVFLLVGRLGRTGKLRCPGSEEPFRQDADVLRRGLPELKEPDLDEPPGFQDLQSAVGLFGADPALAPPVGPALGEPALPFPLDLANRPATVPSGTPSWRAASLRVRPSRSHK